MNKYYMVGPFEGDIEYKILIEDISELFCGTIDECKQKFFKCMTDCFIQYNEGYCPKSIEDIDEKELTAFISTIENTVSLHIYHSSKNGNPDYISCTTCKHEHKWIPMDLEKGFNIFTCRKCKQENRIPTSGESILELSYGVSGGLHLSFDLFLIPVNSIMTIKYDYVLKRKNPYSRYMDSEYELSTKAEDRMYDSNIHQSTNNVDDDVAEDMSKEF